MVSFTEEQFKIAERQGLHNFFKLINYISTDNMHLIDEKGLVTKYSSPDESKVSFLNAAFTIIGISSIHYMLHVQFSPVSMRIDFHFMRRERY